MAYTFSRMEKLVAIFITVAVIITLTMAVFISSQKGLWRMKYTYTTEFKTGKGLKENMPVTLQNIPIGKIGKPRVDNENMVDVPVIIYSEYTDRVREDSVLVLSAGLIGGSELILYPGSPESKKLKNHAFVQSSDTERGELLKKKHELTMKATGLDAMLGNVTSFTKKLSDPDSDISGLLRNVKDITGELSYSMKEGNLSYIMRDPEFKGKLNGALEKLNGTLENLKSTTEMLKSKNDDLKATLENLKAMSENLKKLTGSLAPSDGKSKTQEKTPEKPAEKTAEKSTKKK
ncbi:MAG: MCE family protein [Spirochaetes bacterium]|nr:MCE family protein [Spirochaetota bacterium]